jgi:hypothetical protein
MVSGKQERAARKIMDNCLKRYMKHVDWTKAVEDILEMFSLEQQKVVPIAQEAIGDEYGSEYSIDCMIDVNFSNLEWEYNKICRKRKAAEKKRAIAAEKEPEPEDDAPAKKQCRSA